MAAMHKYLRLRRLRISGGRGHLTTWLLAPLPRQYVVPSVQTRAGAGTSSYAGGITSAQVMGFVRSGGRVIGARDVAYSDTPSF